MRPKQDIGRRWLRGQKPVRFKVRGFLCVLGVLAAMALGSGTSAAASERGDILDKARGLAHYAMGYRYDLLGQTNLAVLEYERAAGFDKDSPVIRLKLGAGYARLNMLEEAVEELKTAHQLDSENLQPRYLLALIYSNQRKYDKAADEYEFILKAFSEAEPRNVEIYSYLGQLYYSQRKYERAAEQFEKILSLDPVNADVMYMLGSLYLEIDRKDQAIQILRESIQIDPEHDGSLNTLGYLYTEEGKNLDEAVDLIGRALKISPDNGAYLDSLGWAYYKKGMYEKALEMLLKADASLKDPVICEHIGDVYHKLNRMEEAVKSWESSLELLPDQESVRQKINAARNIQASR